MGGLNASDRSTKTLLFGLVKQQFQVFTDIERCARASWLAGAEILEVISEIITTRRLLSITQAFSIFNDKAKAISMAISRFDEETKHDFLKLYEKIDAEVELSSDSASAPVEIDPNNPNTCPY